MKTLHLLRHAKSSWDNPGQPDRERGLNKRGKRDAPRMGEALAQRIGQAASRLEHRRGVVPVSTVTGQPGRLHHHHGAIARLAEILPPGEPKHPASAVRATLFAS